MPDVLYPDLKVLIADDDKDIRVALQRILVAYGWCQRENIRIAATAEQALAETKEAPDLVFSDFDFRSPETLRKGEGILSGIQFLEQLRERFGNQFAAIIMSAQNVYEAPTVGATFISKPNDWEKDVEPVLRRILPPPPARSDPHPKLTPDH